MKLEPFLIDALAKTANNAVNKAIDSHERNLDRQKELALEQEQTKRAMLQEEDKIRKAAAELQKKRQANPINTKCSGCTADMTIDRKKGLVICPYCGHTEPLDAVHHYDPMLDGNPEEFLHNMKNELGIKSKEVNDKAHMSVPNNKMTASSRLRKATPSDIEALDNQVDPAPIINKVTSAVSSAAKSVDTKPLGKAAEQYAKNKVSGYILPVISLVCGIIAMISCGIFIIPEIIGLVTGLIPMLSVKSKNYKFSRVIASVGFLMSLSATGIIIFSIFILKK